MNQASHLTTLRQSHRAATTLLPMLTATVTVAGAIIAAMETRAAHAESTAASAAAPADEADGQATTGALAPTPAAYRRARDRAGRVTARSYIATLLGRALLVALGVALVCGLVYTASVSGRVGQAILLTTLVLLTLYLTEKVARRA